MMPYNVRNAGGGSVGGILRRTGQGSGAGSTMLSNGNSAGGQGAGAVGSSSVENHRQTPLELLVFGYACKIFRDDEKAREMDHGKQLIPWMGDVNLKIDRLIIGTNPSINYTINQYAHHSHHHTHTQTDTATCPPISCPVRTTLPLTAAVKKLAKVAKCVLCSSFGQFADPAEEDLKRLQQETSGGSYSQVGFQYDGQSAASSTSSTAPSQLSPNSEESELPFVLPYTLMMAPPLDMQLPETMKQHAIIEKTARFIATQGAQMEILIKAKQANNTQFDFLTQGGYLQPYYRHLLAAIKAAKFPPAPETPLEQQNADKEAHSADDGNEDVAGGRRNPNQVVITVPTIKYKPSANCAYTQLISKIKGVPLQAVLLEDEEDDDEEDGGDLEKYNLLNDDSTNTFTSKPVLPPTAAPPPPLILLSDDDDVQLVATTSSRSSSSRHRKTHRRSRSRSKHDRSSGSSASSRESSRRRRQKSSRRSREPSSIPPRKSQQPSTQRTKTPKKRRRSKSRSRSRSTRRSRSRSILRTKRRSRSRSSSGRNAEQRRQQERRRTPTKKSHKRHKRRRRSSSP
ncbi:LOW QUALITY PROTEIN: suppressor of white-apricot [Drosophila yakuba]|uniref:Suppressor of white-apricot n=1 Tax=Drosophila yakuba TaxID=7245 RepID=B4PXK6_DROYA|nr:LOW QUALITY PROTEIN: suppressor of white-apricot [Drosophila yakuba]